MATIYRLNKLVKSLKRGSNFMEKEKFINWLQKKNVSSYGNYVSRLGKVEEIEGDLDEHFDTDKCVSLLEKFTYTTADKENNRPMKHRITIQPNDENKKYESYYAGTNDYRSRITKYIEFKESDGFLIKQETHIEKLKKTCEQLVSDNQLLSEERLNEGYKRFAQRFSPAILKGLDGEQLLETFLNIGNRDGLTYWLEFKNDEEFVTSAKSYGSIAGGSAFKYILFNRNKDGKWVTGNPQNPTILTVDEAIELAKDIRDSLVAGANLIEKLPERASVQDYIHLQVQLEEVLISNMHNLGWVHKYYHMIYPEKIDSFHATYWKKHALIKSRVMPVQDNKLYSMAGQLMQIVWETELPTTQVILSMIQLFGASVSYYRIGTGAEDDGYWPEMLENSYVAIGLPEIGDMNKYTDTKSRRNEIVDLLVNEYSYDKSTASRKASEVIRLYKYSKIGDVVVAVQGQSVLGIGLITGDYEFIQERPFPHSKSVKWIRVFDEPLFLPKVNEGMGSSIIPYRDLNNIFEIDRLLQEENIAPDPVPVVSLPRLTGIKAEINNILNRKNQVILYGPPGTGKTYHAEKTCYELSSRNLFGKSFEALSEVEQVSIIGDGRTTGTVRMCCFHPSYGYEDFIEGIKPSVVNGQTVFELRDGIFKELCDEAEKNPHKKYYLIIDEINRGDISRIFGELIMLIESGKRGKKLSLSLSNTLFSVPKNVYIVGTMNTADRSIAMLDVALRRRFGFIELMTDYSLFEGVAFEGLPLGGWLKELNNRIREHIGNEARNLQIGHSYFLDKEHAIEDHEKFKWIIREDIIPLIEEYCYSDYALIEKVLGEGLVDVKRQEINSDLFNSPDIGDLVTALLSQNPKLRIETEVEEEEYEDLEDNGIEREEQ